MLPVIFYWCICPLLIILLFRVKFAVKVWLFVILKLCSRVAYLLYSVLCLPFSDFNSLHTNLENLQIFCFCYYNSYSTSVLFVFTFIFVVIVMIRWFSDVIGVGVGVCVKNWAFMKPEYDALVLKCLIKYRCCLIKYGFLVSYI